MKKIGSLVFLFLVFLNFIPKVWADASLQLVPAHPNSKIPQSFTYLIIEGKPGEEKKTEFAGVNLTDEKIELKLETFEAKVNEAGQITANKNTSSQSISNWVSVNIKDTVLLPKERKNFPATVKIPIDANPGQYIAVITSHNSYLPVWINVDGEVKSALTLTSFTQDIQNGQPIFKVKVKNSGNTVVNSLGFKIMLTNFWGVGSSRKLESFWGEESMILTEQEKDFLFNWENTLPFFGNYRADLEVNFGQDKKTNSIMFFFINWNTIGKFIIKFILFVMIAIILVWCVKRLKEKVSLKRIKSDLLPNIISQKQSQITQPSNELISNMPEQDQIKKISFEDKSSILLKEEDYDKLFFRVRKIVREEIELWKEMDNFRKEVKEKLKKEFARKKASN